MTDWLSLLAPFDSWNEKHFLCLCSIFGIPGSMLDVGCGTGAMVNIARKLRVDAYGVDLTHLEHDYLIHANLEESFSMAEHKAPSIYDLVISLEVGEHIDPDFQDIYCDTVANHVSRGGRLVFSSAFPGQGGDEHIGEREAQYWRAKFHDRGLNFRKDWTTILSLHWSNIDSPLFWLPANVQIFER